MKLNEFRCEMAAYQESNFAHNVKIRKVPVMELATCMPMVRHLRDATREKEEETKGNQECPRSPPASVDKTRQSMNLFSPVKAHPLERNGFSRFGEVSNLGVHAGAHSATNTTDHTRATTIANTNTHTNTADTMHEDHPHAFGFAEIKGKEHLPCFAKDPDKAAYDECFPYSQEPNGAVAIGVLGRPVTSTQKIRAGDGVRVLVCGRKPAPHPFSLTYVQAQQQSTAIPDYSLPHSDDILIDYVTEPLWLTVSSITSTGLIHAIAKTSCQKFPLERKAGLLAFPSTCVVGMIRGKNWKRSKQE